MNDHVKPQFEIRKADLSNTHNLAYCRRGYGSNVMPENPSLVEGKLFPTAFLAFASDGKIVGRTVIGFESDPSFWVAQAGGAAAPWIYAVFVEPEFRGFGIGQALVKRSMDFVAAYGFSHICLDSNTAGDWYVDKFNFTKSHSGTYEGEVFDIYFRHLAPPPPLTGMPFITAFDLASLRRFDEHCQDPGCDGHSLTKATMARLSKIGLVMPKPFGYHEMTDLGQWVLENTSARGPLEVRVGRPEEMPPYAEHADDVAVERFAGELKAKLKRSRTKGRGGWQTCPPSELSKQLHEHIVKGDPRDVATYCLFLWSLDAQILAPSQTGPGRRHPKEGRIKPVPGLQPSASASTLATRLQSETSETHTGTDDSWLKNRPVQQED